ncbi:polysaccharide deacetylase family protein [Neobacillus sp. SM06]|uniref:polysaccharide deacetylase family protein n=1 Tax=Neobacillus sp. SM06 TaxID=3422492 RepID=UPI003D2B49E2
MLLLLIILLSLLLLYTLIPFGLSRLGGIGVFQKASHDERLAFTFDDGPDPVYTNELLDLLQKYQVKASFFVVGSRAEQYPEVIRRIYKEGHLIGIHNYVHRSNWLMTPWRVKQGVAKTADILEGITGERPVYYRPPWGALNIFDLFIHKDFRLILWSVMAGDWRSKGGKDKILHHLRKNIKLGSVILLHDCGVTFGAEEEAPKYTIQALKQLIKELIEKGHSFARIDEMVIKEKR